MMLGKGEREFEVLNGEGLLTLLRLAFTLSEMGDHCTSKELP